MRINTEMFAEIAQLQLRGTRSSSGHDRGSRRSRKTGAGQDFADFRPYHPGDSLKRVDWNIYRRLQTVLIRLFHEDRNLQIQVCLDATASMGIGAKFDHAANVAALLSVVGLNRRDRVRLGCIGGIHPMETGVLTGCEPRSIHPFAAFLNRLEAGGHGDEHQQFLAQAAKIRSDQLYFVSDLLMPEPELDRLIRSLAMTSHRPILVHVVSADDVDMDLSGTLCAVDAETGQTVEIRGSRLLQSAYRKEIEHWLHYIQESCARWGVFYVRTDTVENPRDLLLGVLREAGFVYTGAGT